MKIKIKDKIYDVRISEPEEGAVKIKVNGRGFIFRKKSSPENLPKEDQTEGTKKAKKEVRALITGVISKVFIKEKEEVKAGQKLFSLSAMKMENEITAEGEGKVKKIKVEEGQLVKANELLAEME